MERAVQVLSRRSEPPVSWSNAVVEVCLHDRYHPLLSASRDLVTAVELIDSSTRHQRSRFTLQLNWDDGVPCATNPDSGNGESFQFIFDGLAFF